VRDWLMNEEDGDLS
jgi:hypothetical protein